MKSLSRITTSDQKIDKKILLHTINRLVWTHYFNEQGNLTFYTNKYFKVALIKYGVIATSMTINYLLHNNLTSTATLTGPSLYNNYITVQIELDHNYNLLNRSETSYYPKRKEIYPY